MFEWNLKDICKNKLSEKESNSILGDCTLKACFFQLSLKKGPKWSLSIKLMI